MSRVLLCLSLQKNDFFKWSMVGRTVPVVGRRPTMPYPGYATTFDSLTTYGFDQTQVQRYFFSNHV